MNRTLVFVAVLVAFGCNDSCQPQPPRDPDPYADPPRECEDAACADTSACNGAEACDLDTDSCVPAAPRCPAGQTCDPSTGACADCMDGMNDRDGDGAIDIACGGTDCNDWNVDIFPGAGEEACAAGQPSRLLDEDCNPATIGTLDADGDGHVFDECCNRSANGDIVCGTDCDDTDPTRHAGAEETCNRRDDDCDRQIDEGIAASQTFFADCDGDMLGRSDWLSVTLCLNPGAMPAPPRHCETETAAWSTSNNDCNDTNPSILARACVPGSTRPCSGVCTSPSNPRGINTYVNRCTSDYCEWATECKPDEGLAIFDGPEVQPAGAVACAGANACGCTDETDVCVPGGGMDIAQLDIDLPGGRYLASVAGSVIGGAAVDFELVAAGATYTTTSSGSFSLGGEFMVSEGCNPIGVTVRRLDPNAPVIVDGMVLLRLE